MKTEKMHNWLVIILGVVVSLTWLYPFVLIFINSFKTRREIFTNTLFWPEELTTENYPRAYEDLDYTRSFMNSLMITVASIIVIVLFSSMAAYALSRYPGKMIPLVSLFGQFDMLNRVGLTFMNLGFGSSMSIFLYFGALRSVPKSMDEAAILDGANPFQIFWRVVFPLLKPTTVTVIILNSIRIWNDYLLPSLVINKDGMYTIPLQMYYFFGQYTIQWELALAGLVLAIIPIILLYMFLQKHIIQGITEGATK